MHKAGIMQVFHGRTTPAVNQFTYGVPCLLLNVATLEPESIGVVGLDTTRPISFRTSDHVTSEHSLWTWINNITQRHAGWSAASVELLTIPRYWGYAFKPVSFWLCWRDSDHLGGVLAEVNNTFGERHLYWVQHPDGRPIKAEEWLCAEKIFHVSPFFETKGEYRFRFKLSENFIDIRVDYWVDGVRMLKTGLAGQVRLLTPAFGWRALCTYPLATFKIITTIHYQAGKLWLKNVPWFRKPTPPSTSLSLSSSLPPSLGQHDNS
jgi:DUF1365 family protein